MLGRFGPPFLAASRSLHAHGWDVFLLEAISGAPAWREHSSRLAGGAAIAPALLGTAEGLARVRAYAHEIRARALIALSEAHLVWLSRERAAFAPEVELLLPPIEVLRLMHSKRAQIELAQRLGFALLSTSYLGSADDVARVPAADFPVAVRPSTESAAVPLFKVLLAHSHEELAAQLAGVRIEGEGLIAQPFRHLPNLVVHGARTADGEQLALEGFLVARKFEGVTLSICRFPLPERVASQCRAFADEAKLVGCYHFELLWDQAAGQAYYLEVNVRLGGTTEKVLRRGYDEPALLMKAFGQPVGAPSVHSDDRRPVANKRALMKHVWYALRGRLTELDYPAVSRAQHLAASLGQLLTVQDSVFDWSDLRGTIDFHLRRPRP
jgi:predicted ATP-grasp superfamily ATP-dependent carboligase